VPDQSHLLDPFSRTTYTLAQSRERQNPDEWMATVKRILGRIIEQAKESK